MFARAFVISQMALALMSSSGATNESAVWLARIQGTIDPASGNYLEGAIRQAETAQANALVVELDTPGGLVTSVRAMAQAISRSGVPVIVYVTPAGASATSAGALLMLSSHLAAMAPGTNIGAAHPVGGSGEEIKGAMGEKVLNDTAAFARGLAGLRGRNAKLAEEIVSKSKSFTAEEAIAEHLIEVISGSREDLLNQIDGRKLTVSGPQGETIQSTLHTRGASVHSVPMTYGQTLLHYLANPNLAALLMTLGMILIYVEASHPGLGFAGVSGAICLLIAFMALQTLPIRVGAAALVVLGIALLLAEPFITSHGAAAAGGIICFLLGLLWLVDPAAGGGALHVEPLVLAAAGIALGSIVAVIAVAASRMRTLSRRALAEMGGGAFSGLQGYAGTVVECADGKHGRATFRGELWDFESEDRLSAGDSIRAIGLAGPMKIKVARSV